MGSQGRPDKKETNDTVRRKKARRILHCDRCPPNRGCNSTLTRSNVRRGKSKPKHKDHR